MSVFPRTRVGGQSVSRMIVGTNWFLGWSHCTPAKDTYIKENVATRKVIADILEVFFKAGVDTLMGPIIVDPLSEAIEEAQDRTGVEAIIVSTPWYTVGPETPEQGLDLGEVEKVLDEEVRRNVRISMPHQATTDNLVDRCTHTIRHMDVLCHMMRERGLIPGLSTHMPNTIVYADESGLDVETYIAVYNTMGFLMQVEVDWVHRIIHNAKKPVMTIKPMAAGQVRPFQGLTFVWNTIRDQDMVTVGTMSPREAAEVIEISLDTLSKRAFSAPLQETRSKHSLKT